MRRGSFVVVGALVALSCSGEPETSDADDAIGAIVTAIDTQADSIVRAAIQREGLTGVDAPAPGLGDAYFRAPRRHGQVKRHYEAWLRVDAALRPSLMTAMRTNARRLENEADLDRVAAMNLPVFVEAAVHDREWELELRKQLADLAVSVYDQSDAGSGTTLSPAGRSLESERLGNTVAERSLTVTRNHFDRISRQLGEVMARRANQYGLHDRPTPPGE